MIDNDSSYFSLSRISGSLLLKITELTVGALNLKLFHLLTNQHKLYEDLLPVLTVDGVSVSWSVYHGETELHPPLLNFYCRCLDLNRPFYLLYMKDKARVSACFCLYGVLIHRGIYTQHKSGYNMVCVFYLPLQVWLSQGIGQWGRGCWWGWISQVQIPLKTEENKAACNKHHAKKKNHKKPVRTLFWKKERECVCWGRVNKYIVSALQETDFSLQSTPGHTHTNGNTHQHDTEFDFVNLFKIYVRWLTKQALHPRKQDKVSKSVSSKRKIVWQFHSWKLRTWISLSGWTPSAMNQWNCTLTTSSERLCR